MNLGLDGRTAIVCGASSGMGLATAEALSAEGANVTIVGRRRELLEGHAERIGALAVRADITDKSDLQRIVDRTLEAFGGIDILVNNGGGPPPGSALDLSDESIEEAVELLLLSAVRLTNLCLPHLTESGRGRVINICSTSVREPIDNLALSNAVRPGVIGWAKTLAREVGSRGITVNSIAPGSIDTERIRQLGGGQPSAAALEYIPLKRYGRPEEIGSVACFLASEQASYITGAVITVDGGRTRSL